MKPFLFVTGAVAAGALAMGCGPQALSAMSPATGQAPVHVDCGPGRGVVMRPVVVGGDKAWRAECVDVALSDGWTAPQLATPAQPVAYRPAPPPVETIVPRPVVRERVVYRRAPRREGRSWKKSAAIIGGGAAAGAGVGAVIDGGRGAKKGAVLGGLAGVVYDIATRAKDDR